MNAHEQSSLFAPRLAIGGKGGAERKAYESDGRVLEKIGVWAGESAISGIKVWRTGLQPAVFGTRSGPYQEYSFEPGERISRLSLWGNGAGTRLGAIAFTTDRDGKFDHGMTKWGRKQEYPIDVGSGICVGLLLRSGHEIDQGCFVFLKEIESCRMSDVHYPTLEFDMLGIRPVTLKSGSYSNQTDDDVTWQFSGTRTTTVSQEWSTTTGVEASAEVSVEAGVPEVASVKGSFGWKVSSSSTHSRSKSTEIELEWSEGGILSPGDSLRVTALTREGRLAALEYTATMTVTVRGGGSFSYPIESTYAGVNCTAVEITTDGSNDLEPDAAPEPAATLPYGAEAHRLQPA